MSDMTYDLLDLPRLRAVKIAELEAAGRLDPTCRGCDEHYRFYRERWDPAEPWMTPFAPPHTALSSCRSGGYAHCTCDSCF